MPRFAALVAHSSEVIRLWSSKIGEQLSGGVASDMKPIRAAAKIVSLFSLANQTQVISGIGAAR